ncbi:hypothetical protein BRADI_1g78105v3 [Brachypodium distachyon]|uniref:Cation-transporting P-type ATPase N-terminal domain-containing protein n=1 Tax=Brachypodium distachyon TaxID=15368 RepID=A0A2K2DVP9_BRADI|nr:hypothetical protein BRADI_1g78105v3 [Brachypodium distachyon]PNT78355.1 hypothetical protein BRADI_1g78105v3 [Brachypodium distachyon]
MASPEDMVAELETAAAEVLRRLGTGENAGGLTGEEAARRLRVHGPNIVLRSHHEDSMLQNFVMTIFSLWGWDHVFPKYNNMIYTVSSTAHLLGVRVIFLLWNFDLSSFLALVIAAFNCWLQHFQTFFQINLKVNR